MHLEIEEEAWENDEDSQLIAGERLHFTSVGIDVGSSTSHLIFSRLVLIRRGKEYYSGYTVVKREILYRSPVIFTPFNADHSRVDAARLRDFIRREYGEAGLLPTQVDTGAVITTGEAAKKENTAAIIDALAAEAGNFVCAAAGPNMEALLAAHGSGAVQHSLQHKDSRETIVNIDIGGGTAKIAVVTDGRVAETCAVNVGSRLMAWDEEGALVRLEEAGVLVASSLGIPAAVGMKLALPEKEALAEKLADVLFEILERRPLGNLAQSLLLTPEISYRGPFDLAVYSGGVAEFIYGEEKNDFRDLGALLGRAVMRRQREGGVALGYPAERIRATVIGASQYTVQVSGNTIFLSDPALLPLHNLPVIALPPLPNPLTRLAVAEVMHRNFLLCDLTPGKKGVAIAVQWDQDPDLNRFQEFAEGLALALRHCPADGQPVVLIFDNDIGGILGHVLSDRGIDPLIAIDNINVGQLSYVDIGRPLTTTRAVPVTVKSLVFH